MSGISKWNAPRGTTISETADGEYVLASDYDALRAELDNCQRAWGLQRSEIDGLLREIQALRAAPAPH